MVNQSATCNAIPPFPRLKGPRRHPLSTLERLGLHNNYDRRGRFDGLVGFFLLVDAPWLCEALVM